MISAEQKRSSAPLPSPMRSNALRAVRRTRTDHKSQEARRNCRSRTVNSLDIGFAMGELWSTNGTASRVFFRRGLRTCQDGPGPSGRLTKPMPNAWISFLMLDSSNRCRKAQTAPVGHHLVTKSCCAMLSGNFPAPASRFAQSLGACVAGNDMKCRRWA